MTTGKPSPDSSSSSTVAVQPQTVTPGEIYEQYLGGDDPGSVSSLHRQLTSTQRVGLWLALPLLAVILIVTLWLFIDSAWHAPKTPVLAGNVSADSAAARATIEYFRSLNDAVKDRTMEYFDAVVAKMLFPTLTTILGYILGKSDHKAES